MKAVMIDNITHIAQGPSNNGSHKYKQEIHFKTNPFALYYFGSNTDY